MANPKSILLSLLSCFIGLVFLAGCSEKKKITSTPGPLFPKPKTVRLNLDEGYAVNQITGDSIKPIILENGGTLITGVPIKVTPKVIYPDSVVKPQSFKVTPESGLRTKNTQPNVKKKTNEPVVVSINTTSLTKIDLEPISENDTTHYYVNSIGDSIKTGIQIPMVGKAINYIASPITTLLPRRFKDGTIENLQYLDVDQGIPSSYINCLFQDKKGNIWFGTSDKGICKFNGEFLVSYNLEGGSGSFVSSILEDQVGNIWFSTDDGVFKYDGITFIQFDENQGLCNNKVNEILEDKEGNIWFGSIGGLSMLSYNDNHIINYTENEGLTNNMIFSILEDKSGDVWIGSSKGVDVFDGKSFTNYSTKEGLVSNTINTMLADRNGNIWFGSNYGGVSCFNGDTFINYTEKESGIGSVFDIIEDSDGEIWFSTNEGVGIYDGSSFVIKTKNKDLNNHLITSIIEDCKGSIWLGTYGGGVSVFKEKSFTHITNQENPLANQARYLLLDKKGNLWIGTPGNGLLKYTDKHKTKYTPKDGLCGYVISSVLEDRTGNIWIGSWFGGVSKYDGVSFTNFSINEGFFGGRINTMLQDSRGNIWFGTKNGVIKYNGEKFINYYKQDAWNNVEIESIFEDKNGNLWFASKGSGVFKFNGDYFTIYTEKEGLSSNNINSVLEDKTGNLWFGSDKGISRLSNKSLEHYTVKEGLSDNMVTSILEDEFGNIWIGTENGLNQLVSFENQSLEGHSKKAEFTIHNFNKLDGLKGADFIMNSVIIDNEKVAWWGTDKCITNLDLTNYKVSETSPEMHLRQLDINEQFIDYNNISDSLSEIIEFDNVQRFDNYPLNLKLSSDKNHITFHFSAIDWSAPHKIQYSYVMEGLETEWSKSSKEAKADYRNLPHGTFTFKVMAIGESQEWSESYDYTFTILPPWYHTWWARTLYVLGGILLVYSLIKWRTSKLKKRQEELEIEVQNATQEIIEQKQEVEKQKEHIEEVHKEITDSINYAERIQKSFLATEDLLNKNLTEYFVFFQPKDVVSGDFYWADELSNGQFAMVNADSTGHGVPGAIMSILNISSIEEAVKEGATAPHDIFNRTRKFIIDRLSKDGSKEGGKDGMDASIICFDFKQNVFHYTAAQNPIWIVRDGELIDIKPEKMPMGKHDHDHISFVGGSFDMEKGDVIYTLTDGFQDQFGGPKGKKFKIKPFKNILIENAHLPLAEQKEILKTAFENWRGDQEQVDDVCVIGVRV